jgi:hypothetical protein
MLIRHRRHRQTSHHRPRRDLLPPISGHVWTVWLAAVQDSRRNRTPIGLVPRQRAGRGATIRRRGRNRNHAPRQGQGQDRPIAACRHPGRYSRLHNGLESITDSAA